MRPSAVPEPPATDREEELARAEHAVRASEAQLRREAAAIQERLEALAATRRAFAERLARYEDLPDLDVGGLARRHGAAAAPRVEVERHLERAHAARVEAVQLRRKAVEAAASGLKTSGAELAATTAQLAADEEALAGALARDAQIRETERLRRVEQTRNLERRRREETPAAVATGTPAPSPLALTPHRVLARVAMQAAVDLSSDSNFFTGFSTNIGEGGLFIATVNVVPRGTPVDVAFTLPSGRRMEVHGEVRWTREVNDSTPDIFPGVGVHFVDLDPAVAAQIKGFVVQREPLFYPD